MIVNELKKSILDYAISGKLTKQNIDEKINLQEGLELEIDPLMFDIPENWKWTKVKNICSLIRGNGIKKDEVTNQGVQCIRYGEIYTQYSYTFYKAVSFVDEDLAKKCQKVKKGDLLITLTGENEYDIAKATAYLGEDELVAGGDLAILTNHIQNPKYLTYYFASPFAIKQKAKTAKGNIIVHTSADKVGEYFIPIPPIEEQERIVNKIEELFLKLDEIKPIEEELNFLKNKFPEDMKNSILQEAYEGKWSNDYASWNKKKINEICNEMCTGNSISESIKKTKYMNLAEGYNYIGTKDLNFDHSFDYENGVKIPFDEPKFRYANSKDILLCIEGGSAGKKIGILEEKVCYGNKLCKFDVKNEVLPEFLYYYLQSPIFLKNFYDNLSGIIGGVSISKIRTIEFEYPDIEEQKRIVEKIEKILTIIESISNMY